MKTQPERKVSIRFGQQKVFKFLLFIETLEDVTIKKKVINLHKNKNCKKNFNNK